MDKLEPCPFCNGQPKILFMMQAYSLTCACGAGMDEFDTEAEAIAAWNRRPTDPRYGEAHSGLDAEQRHNRELSAMVDDMAPPPLCPADA